MSNFVQEPVNLTKNLAGVQDLRGRDAKAAFSGVNGNLAFALDGESSGYVKAGNGEQDVFDYGNSPGTQDTLLDGGDGKRDTLRFGVSTTELLNSLKESGYVVAFRPDGSLSLFLGDQEIRTRNLEFLQTTDARIDIADPSSVDQFAHLLRESGVPVIDMREANHGSHEIFGQDSHYSRSSGYLSSFGQHSSQPSYNHYGQQYSSYGSDGLWAHQTSRTSHTYPHANYAGSLSSNNQFQVYQADASAYPHMSNPYVLVVEASQLSSILLG